ncbi:MAG: TAXI family TRAP transporter solute-binding subunit [Geminicoccaceae bacterium]
MFAAKDGHRNNRNYARLPSFAVQALIIVTFVFALDAMAQDTKSPRQIRRELNANAIKIITGDYFTGAAQMAADLASVVDDDQGLRLVPISGTGPLQNISDILYLKGIDLAIVQTDMIRLAQEQQLFKGLERRISYVSKLFDADVHLLARADIESISDLSGRSVNLGPAGSGSDITAATVMGLLGINPTPTYHDHRTAIDMIKVGTLDAAVVLDAKPAKILDGLDRDAGIKLLEIPATPELLGRYKPTKLSPSDYPDFIEGAEGLATISVETVLVAFNWKPDTSRYEVVSRFVNGFFSSLGSLQQSRFHAKWAELDLHDDYDSLPRFNAAATWLQENPGNACSFDYTDDELRKALTAFMTTEMPAVLDTLDVERSDQVFQAFANWFRENADQP